MTKHMFTQKISMDCTRKQYEKYLKDELLKTGYKEVGLDWYSEEDVIVNNLNGCVGHIGSTTKSTNSRYDRLYLGSFNAPLFLALAAMTDSEEGVLGHKEWIKQKKGSDWVRGTSNNRYNDAWRKATKEEIMVKFKVPTPVASPESQDFSHYSVGDYVTLEYQQTKRVTGIVGDEVVKGNGGFKMLAGYTSEGSSTATGWTFGIQKGDVVRYATQEERYALDTLLCKMNYQYDPLLKRVVPIVLDSGKEDARASRENLKYTTKGEYYYCESVSGTKWVFISAGGPEKTSRIASAVLRERGGVFTILDGLHTVMSDSRIKVLRLATPSEIWDLDSQLCRAGLTYDRENRKLVSMGKIVEKSKEESTSRFDTPLSSAKVERMEAIQDAIILLKSEGYKIQKPILQPVIWEEI